MNSPVPQRMLSLSLNLAIIMEHNFSCSCCLRIVCFLLCCCCCWRVTRFLKMTSSGARVRASVIHDRDSARGKEPSHKTYGNFFASKKRSKAASRKAAAPELKQQHVAWASNCHFFLAWILTRAARCCNAVWYEYYHLHSLHDVMYNVW